MADPVACDWALVVCSTLPVLFEVLPLLATRGMKLSELQEENDRNNSKSNSDSESEPRSSH